jgi:hypothetical protein
MIPLIIPMPQAVQRAAPIIKHAKTTLATATAKKLRSFSVFEPALRKARSVAFFPKFMV